MLPAVPPEFRGQICGVADRRGEDSEHAVLSLLQRHGDKAGRSFGVLPGPARRPLRRVLENPGRKSSNADHEAADREEPGLAESVDDGKLGTASPVADRRFPTRLVAERSAELGPELHDPAAGDGDREDPSARPSGSR